MDWQPIKDALFQSPWDVKVFMGPLWLIMGIVGSLEVVVSCARMLHWATIIRNGQPRSRGSLGMASGEETSTSAWGQLLKDYRVVLFFIGLFSLPCLYVALAPLAVPKWLLASLGVSSPWQLLPNGVTLLEQRIRISGWSSFWLVITIAFVAIITWPDPAKIVGEKKKEPAESAIGERKEDEKTLIPESAETVGLEGEGMPDSPRREGLLEEVLLQGPPHFYIYLSEKNLPPPYIWLDDERWELKQWRMISSTEICFGEGRFTGAELYVESRTVSPGTPGRWVCLRLQDRKVLAGHVLPDLDRGGRRQFTYDTRRREESVRDGEFFTVCTPRGRLLLQFSLSAPAREGKETKT